MAAAATSYLSTVTSLFRNETIEDFKKNAIKDVYPKSADRRGMFVHIEAHSVHWTLARKITLAVIAVVAILLFALGGSTSGILSGILNTAGGCTLAAGIIMFIYYRHKHAAFEQEVADVIKDSKQGTKWNYNFKPLKNLAVGTARTWDENECTALEHRDHNNYYIHFYQTRELFDADRKVPAPRQ